MFSEHHTPEAELEALPGCQLLRSPSEREGLTTFTVVPHRRQPSGQCFEVPLILQTPDTDKAEEDLCPGDPDALETATTELLEEVLKFERNEDTGSDESEHLSEILHLQQVENENQALADIESEDLEMKDEDDQCVHPKNIEMESLESLQRGLNNLEHFDSKMNNLELRDGWVSPANKLADSSPIDPNTGLEREEMEEHDSVETEEEKDWVEQYKERRRKFLDGDSDGMKRFDVWGRIQGEFTNFQDENTMKEMDFPSPPPPVWWNENSSESKEDMENGSEQDVQSCDEHFDLSANSKPKYVPYPHYSQPKAHSTQTSTEPNTIGAENSCSFAPSEPHKTLLFSKSHSSVDPCPPAAVSLFTLAVFQRAKCSKQGLDPNCSRR